jgi:hypothetical protein
MLLLQLTFCFRLSDYLFYFKGKKVNIFLQLIHDEIERIPLYKHLPHVHHISLGLIINDL